MKIDDVEKVIKAVECAKARLVDFESGFKGSLELTLTLMTQTYLDGYQDAKDNPESPS